MKYNVAFKHLEKITKNASGTRHVLKGIHHLDNQVQATDSYRLLKVVADKMNFDEHILDTKSQTEIDGKYPNTTQLADHSFYEGETIGLTVTDIKLIRDLIKVAKGMKFEMVVINTLSDYSRLEMTNKIQSNNTKELNETLEKINLSYKLSNHLHTEYNYNYLIDINYALEIFEFLVDTKKDTMIKLNNNNQPIHFLNDDYDYLVMPIRNTN